MRLNFWLAYKLLFSRKILFGGSAPLSFLGLVLGVAALVVSMGVLSGYSETLEKAMTDVTGEIQIVKRGKLIEDWPKFSQSIMQADPSIKSTMRFAYAEAVLAAQGRVSGVLLQGVEVAQLENVLNLAPRVKIGDLKIEKNKIVIGQGLAKAYNLNVGDKIYLIVPLATPFEDSGFRRKSDEFQITGVLDFGKNDWNNRLVISDLKDLQILTDIGDRYTGAFVRTNNRSTAGEISFLLQSKLGTGFSIMTWYDINRNIFEAVALERIVIFLVVLLIVIVAAVNISSALYVFVRQKYSDIAILKALGMSQKRIRLIFLSQGMLIGLAGTILGIILGYDMCYGFMYLQNEYSVISGSVYKIDNIVTDIRVIDLLAVVLVTQVICFLATCFPAIKGSKLEVIEGLKNG